MRLPKPVKEPLLHPDFKAILKREQCAAKTPDNGWPIDAAHMPRPRGKGRHCLPMNYVTHMIQETEGYEAFFRKFGPALLETIAELYIRIARLEGYDGPIYADGSG